MLAIFPVCILVSFLLRKAIKGISEVRRPAVSSLLLGFAFSTLLFVCYFGIVNVMSQDGVPSTLGLVILVLFNACLNFGMVELTGNVVVDAFVLSAFAVGVSILLVLGFPIGISKMTIQDFSVWLLVSLAIAFAVRVSFWLRE